LNIYLGAHTEAGADGECHRETENKPQVPNSKGGGLSLWKIQCVGHCKTTSRLS